VSSPFAFSNILRFSVFKTGILKTVAVKMSTCLLKNLQVAKQHLPPSFPFMQPGCHSICHLSMVTRSKEQSFFAK
jgi:hypothetical protein